MRAPFAARITPFRMDVGLWTVLPALYRKPPALTETEPLPFSLIEFIVERRQ